MFAFGARTSVAFQNDYGPVDLHECRFDLRGMVNPFLAQLGHQFRLTGLKQATRIQFPLSCVSLDSSGEASSCPGVVSSLWPQRNLRAFFECSKSGLLKSSLSTAPFISSGTGFSEAAIGYPHGRNFKYESDFALEVPVCAKPLVLDTLVGASPRTRFDPVLTAACIHPIDISPPRWR
jgi:hypothetical protein